MGASQWYYFVPYQPSIQHAFQMLQATEFQEANYSVRPAFPVGDITLNDFLPHDTSSVTEAELADLRAQFEALQREVQPDSFATLEELRAWNGPDGMHSILDMEAIRETQPPEHALDAWLSADTTRMGLIWPLTADQLRQLFGTTQPTHLMVMAARQHYGRLRNRWEGLYIIVYANDQPSEIFFTGFSGD